MATHVLVHGAWHTGELLEAAASFVRKAGHEVHCPTLAGNAPGDDKRVGLEDAIASIVDFLAGKNLSDVILFGHSFGGMVVTGVANRVPQQLRRLVYQNALFPSTGKRSRIWSP